MSNCIYSSDGLLMCMESFSNCPGTDHSHNHDKLSNGKSCTGDSECNSNYCCPQTNVCKAKENFSNKNNVKPYLNIETFASTCGSGSYQSGLGSKCEDDNDCISGFCNTDKICANRV